MSPDQLLLIGEERGESSDSKANPPRAACILTSRTVWLAQSDGILVVDISSTAVRSSSTAWRKAPWLGNKSPVVESQTSAVERYESISI